MTHHRDPDERLQKSITCFITYPRLGTNASDRDPTSFPNQIYFLLDQHLDNPLVSVDWLASQLGMNRKQLYRQITRQTHLSPSALIRLYRLQRAIDLLTEGHTITEAAYRIGFNTPTQFARVFRQFYKQTPTEYMANRD